MGRTPGPAGPEGCGRSGFCPKTGVGEASDERHSVSRFAFEKVPPPPSHLLLLIMMI